MYQHMGLVFKTSPKERRIKMYTKHKLEDMDISLRVSAAQSGLTLQTWTTKKWLNTLWAFSGYENHRIFVSICNRFHAFFSNHLWMRAPWTKLNDVKTGSIARESSIWNYQYFAIDTETLLVGSIRVFAMKSTKVLSCLEQKEGLPKMINKSILLWKDSQMAHFLSKYDTSFIWKWLVMSVFSRMTVAT